MSSVFALKAIKAYQSYTIMCVHADTSGSTKNVNAYYFGETDVDADNDGNIYECRKRGFEALERQPDFLQNTVIEGSYGEDWSLRKVLRRIIWHDRIHARAMYRMGVTVFGTENVVNPFCF